MHRLILCTCALLTLGAAEAQPFPAGALVQAGPGGSMPLGWTLPDYARQAGALVQEGDQTHFNLTWPHLGYVFPTCAVAVDPRWTDLRLSLRVRVQSVTPKDAGHGFLFRSTFTTVDGRVLTHFDAAVVDRETGWITLTAQGKVPEGAAKLTFAPGFYQASGSVDMADLKLMPTWNGQAPDPLPEIVPLQP